MGTSRRILVVAPNWIGDALLAQPLLARLAARGATVTVLAPRWTAAVCARMPEVAAIIDAPFDHGELRLRDRYRLARTLAGRFDEAIVLPNSAKAALVPLFARIPVRTGYLGESRYGLVNRRHRLDERALPLMVDRYAQLAEPPGAPIERPLPAVGLRVDVANRERAIASLGLDPAGRIIAICPGAEYGPAKRWPVEHFAALTRSLVARGDAVWIFGSTKERSIGDEIVAASATARCINLCGRTTLEQAIDLMSLAAAVVTNDSGLMHVAAALDRPLVALFGSSSPTHTPPLAATARIVHLGLECSPCYARECPLGHFRCMTEITPEHVAGLLPAR